MMATVIGMQTIRRELRVVFFAHARKDTVTLQVDVQGDSFADASGCAADKDGFAYTRSYKLTIMYSMKIYYF
jgi:hypothetical protein